MRGLYIRRRKSSRNSEYSVPDQSLMYERFRKAKIDLPGIFVEFTNKQKRSLTTKPRGGKHPKVAKRGGNGNAIRMMDTIMTQTYYCDVSKWRMARSACWMLL